MSKQNVLVIVAYPDVESLWFYGGLSRLAKKFHVEILCLTGSAATNAAKEVITSTVHLAVNVNFANLTYEKPAGYLSDAEASIRNRLSQKNYKMVVTHPPHGGEKRNAHSMQCFHVVRRLANDLDIRFGFFSEAPVMSAMDGKYRFRFRLIDHLRLTKEYLRVLLECGAAEEILIIEAFLEMWFIIKAVLKVRKYYLFSFFPLMFRKKRKAEVFSPEMEDLVKKKSLMSATEYLYLQKL